MSRIFSEQEPFANMRETYFTSKYPTLWSIKNIDIFHYGSVYYFITYDKEALYQLAIASSRIYTTDERSEGTILPTHHIEANLSTIWSAYRESKHPFFQFINYRRHNGLYLRYSPSTSV